MESLKETLSSVVLSLTDKCNRHCKFCPHGNGFEPMLEDMTVSTAANISRFLNGFTGRVRLSGYGEPLLNCNILEIVDVLKRGIDGDFELITNGDLLNEYFIHALLSAGITRIVVSMHDGSEQASFFKDMFENVNTKDYELRSHWDAQQTFNSRCGHAYESTKTPVKRVCYLPFYKMRIDSNGDVGLCCQDWGKTVVIDNVANGNLEEMWLSDKLNMYRRQLLFGGRVLLPCSTCDVIGDVYGKESFDRFKESWINQ